jgi:hypothetical protein
MSIATFIGLALAGCFLLGILVGNGYTTHQQDQRDRRQAATQRELNAWTRGLHEMAERQTAKEEELRWRYLEQAGLVVVDHDTAKEVAAIQPRQVRRSGR